MIATENAEMGFAPNAEMRKAYAAFLGKMGIMGCSPSDAFYHGWIAALNALRSSAAFVDSADMGGAIKDAYSVSGGV